MSNNDINRAREIEERALEYQRDFSYERFRVIRKELFAHLRDPAMTIRTDSVTFNSACINKLEGVVYIKLYIDHNAKQLAIKECDPDDKNAIRWCVEKKDGTHRSRKITGRDFSNMIYTLMEWDRKKRYKIIGFMIEVDGEDVFLFDLTMTEKFDAMRGRKKRTFEEATQIEGSEKENTDYTESAPVEEVKSPPLSDFSEKITSTYGETVEEDLARRQQDLTTFSEVQ